MKLQFQDIKKFIYTVFNLFLWAPFLGVYFVFNYFVLCSAKRERHRKIATLNLVIPYEPGEKSGASNGIKSLIDDFKASYRLNLVPLYNQSQLSAAKRWLSELMTSAIPMPRHCRHLMLSPGLIMSKIDSDSPIFIEFVSGSLFLFFRKKPSRLIVLRDHENLCRRLVMEYAKSKGIGRVFSMSQVLVCYLFLCNVYTKVDKIVTLTIQDEEYTKKYFPLFAGKAMYISRSFNLPDKDVPAPSLEPGTRDIMYLANFYHKPNTDGLLWFLQNVAPHLDGRFTLHLVGLDEPLDGVDLDATHINIIRHGFVEDIDTTFKNVGIAISPTISGSGIRTKSLFLAGKKKAIVTTALGNECIEFIHGKEAVIVDDGRLMAEELNRLIHKPDEIISMGSNAFRKVKERFDSSAIVEKYRQAVFNA